MLANEKTFNKKSVIKFDYRQRINIFRLNNAVQCLLMLKKRKIGDGKCITTIKCLEKPILCTLYWNDKAISKIRLEIGKEFLLNEINEVLLKEAKNNLRCV